MLGVSRSSFYIIFLSGLSCEECSRGHYRVKAEGSQGGACVPCECNGHATECDVNTGVCLVCILSALK